MVEFFDNHKPQHAELDELILEWGPVGDVFAVHLVRRMRRHDHPESELRLTFEYGRNGRDDAGSAPIATWRDAVAQGGYRLVRGARVRRRDLSQS